MDSNRLLPDTVEAFARDYEMELPEHWDLYAEVLRLIPDSLPTYPFIENVGDLTSARMKGSGELGNQILEEVLSSVKRMGN